MKIPNASYFFFSRRRYRILVLHLKYTKVPHFNLTKKCKINSYMTGMVAIFSIITGLQMAKFLTLDGD